MAGTTLDVSDAVAGAMRGALDEVGAAVPEARIRDVRGRAKLEALRSRLASRGRTDSRLAERVHMRFREELLRLASESVRPIEGAARAISWIRGRRIPVWLTTGFDRGLANVLLGRVGWGPELVSGLVTSDDVAQGRPEPDMVLRAMLEAGIEDPDAVLVAGDTWADLDAAWAARVGYAVAVLTGANDRKELEDSRHSVILASVAGVPGWLRSEGAVEP